MITPMNNIAPWGWLFLNDAGKPPPFGALIETEDDQQMISEDGQNLITETRNGSKI